MDNSEGTLIEPEGVPLEDVLGAIPGAVEGDFSGFYELTIRRASPGYYVGRLYQESGDEYTPLHVSFD